MAAICLGLVLLVFAQSAGSTSTDTKIDLVVDPMRFLRTTLRLWDPIGNSGQLQNQAYGYLFPMGPFFALTHGLGFAPWEMQRLWQSALVLGAFYGSVRLSRALGVRGWWPPVCVGLVYAMSPRMLSELTTISSELMPMAAMPWMILPLVRGTCTGSVRSAAGRSGVALLFAGGVNAAATLAVLPAPALWILTRSHGPRRTWLAAWWVLAVALASSWWGVPLLLLGKYSPPFLDYIESSSATTLPTSLIATLRGVDHWESYLGPDVWRGAWIFAAAPLVIVATTVVAAAGLWGLARRDVPHRGFLCSCLVLGLVLVTMGHAAEVGPPGAGTVRHLLDGPLVAFRNVHKFDPLVRLPIAIGVGHLLSRLRLPHRVKFGRRGATIAVRALAVVATAGIGVVAVTPAVSNQVTANPRLTTEPGWWRDAADWLAEHYSGGRALVVPGATSSVYAWGTTIDDALQPVARSPWALRNAVPLAPAGYIRLLDEVESIFSTGAGSAVLAPLLARSGISDVVVRNDLQTGSSVATPLDFVRSTADNSPGMQLAAQFGPEVSGSSKPNNVIDAGIGEVRPAVQIYHVNVSVPQVELTSIDSGVQATGSADALPTLLSRGLPPASSVAFGPDGSVLAGGSALRVVTDGIRRRDAIFGNQIGASNTLTASDPNSGQRRAYDYLPENAGPLSVYRYTGIKDLTATSSGSDVAAWLNRSPSHEAWSALDGDPQTAWESGSLGGAVGQSLRISLLGPTDPGTMQIAFTTSTANVPTQLAITTDRGTRIADVRPDGSVQTVALPPGPTSTVKIVVRAVAGGGPGSSVGISELRLAGITPGRTLVVPAPATGTTADLLAFDAASGFRSSCLTYLGMPACDPTFAAEGEETAGIDRTVTLGAAAEYLPSASVRLRGGTALDAALDHGSPIRVSASSTIADDPRVRAGAVVDDDPTTMWIAAPGDGHPSLTLRLPAMNTISGLTLTTDPNAGVAAPRRVEVRVGGHSWQFDVPGSGTLTFPAAVRATSLTVAVTQASLRTSTSSVTNRSRLLSVGISDVSLQTAQPLAAVDSDGTLSLSCTAGVAMSVDGRSVSLQIHATRSDVLAGNAVAARPCAADPITLSRGTHRMSLLRNPRIDPVGITFTRAGVAAWNTGGTPAQVSTGKWSATSRSVRVDTDQAALLVVHENDNAGWQARVNGHLLKPVMVDGWQQGWVVPAGTHGEVQLRYVAQRGYEVSLWLGALAGLVVIGLALVRPRRPVRWLALADAHAPAWLTLVLIAAAATALAGVPGLAVTAVLVGLIAVLSSREIGLPPAAGGAALLIGGVLCATAQSIALFTEANSARTQYLCVVAVVATAIGGSTVVGARKARVQGRDP
ncbi:MAG: alpha-(1-_3)-arabinofuranosyltransferase domain-containing protein [Jatrophihabitans sp.]